MSEEFPVYGIEEGSVKFDSIEDSDYFDEIRSWGYEKHVDFLKGYHFISDSNSYLELLCFRHKKDGTSICVLWNYYQEVFRFYCNSRYAEFKCLKDLIDISISLIKYQQIAKALDNE